MEAREVLIDTCLFIEHIRSRDKSGTLLARIQEKRHRLITSSIVVAELCYGARSAQARTLVDEVLFGVEILPFTAEMAFQVALEAERMRSKSILIGFRDLAIACVALRTSLPVATHNRAEFSRVSGLEVLELEAVE